MKSAWKQGLCLLLALLLAATLLSVPAMAGEGGLELYCTSFEIRDGAAEGIVEIVNGTDAAVSGDVYAALFAGEQFAGIGVIRGVTAQPGASLRKAVTIPAANVDPDASGLSVKLMFAEGGSAVPLTGAAGQLGVSETQNMPDYRFHDDGTYARQDDAAVYANAIGQFDAMMAAAKEAATLEERFVLEAKAEAYLLDAAVLIPTTSTSCSYAISRIAPRTVPYVKWGVDDDRVFGLVISDEFLTPDERTELLDQWSKACIGQGAYDPAAYLKSKGHTLQDSYTLTCYDTPVTLDWLSAPTTSDLQILVNFADGLVQYDNLNRQQPALAESWEISDDGLTYTFHIRHGAKWYTADGSEYAEVTAHDFEAGFRHMLDADAFLSWLVYDVIVGVDEYCNGEAGFDGVGYKAVDDYTLEIKLADDVPYFMSMLSYNIFLPICKSFYEAHGGVFGREELQAAVGSGSCTFGQISDVTSQVYCGPFLLQKLQPDSEVVAVKNPKYYNADKVTLNSIRWIYDDASNPTAVYNDTVNGVYAGTTLTGYSGTLELAMGDGNFDKYAYVTEPTSTTYIGGLNLNRGTFALESGACASPKTEQQRIDTVTALQNKAFRQALQFAFDKAAYNAVSRGEELALVNLRNMYTDPKLVSLRLPVTDPDGHSFPVGTFYGDMVQYYLGQLGSPITVADGCNGWYHPDIARERLATAKEELGGLVSFPIHIDVVYYSPSEINTAQAQAYKESIEAVLGSENVTVNLIEAATSSDYYTSGYSAANGAACNFDMFYGTGWGPEFGDPCTYLDTFLSGGVGYMTRYIGLF